MTKEVKDAINEFVNKQFINRDGVTMDTVVKKDRKFVKKFLIDYFNAFKKFFASEEDAEKLFVKRLSRITHLRFDKTNQYEMPLKLAFDDMKKTKAQDDAIAEKDKIIETYEKEIIKQTRKEEKDKLAKQRDDEIFNLNKRLDNTRKQIENSHYDYRIDGGVCFPAKDHDMFALLIPDFMVLDVDSATHTSIHEFTHAMTMIDEGDYYRIGVKIDKKNKMQNALNEGFTELIAQRLWMQMYPNKKCPGVGRYRERVDAIKEILSTFADDGDVIEDYLVDGAKTIETLKNMFNSKGEDLYSYFEKMYSVNLNPADRKKAISKIGDFVLIEDYQHK